VKSAGCRRGFIESASAQPTRFCHGRKKSRVARKRSPQLSLNLYLIKKQQSPDHTVGNG
jgi:hypothetical protein